MYSIYCGVSTFSITSEYFFHHWLHVIEKNKTKQKKNQKNNFIFQMIIIFPQTSMKLPGNLVSTGVPPQTQQPVLPVKFLFTGVRAPVSRQPVYLLCCSVTFFLSLSLAMSSNTGTTPDIAEAFSSLTFLLRWKITRRCCFVSVRTPTGIKSLRCGVQSGRGIDAGLSDIFIWCVLFLVRRHILSPNRRVVSRQRRIRRRVIPP